jgi:hypothetical protein
MGELAGRREPVIADKVRFLADPAAYPHQPATVQVEETHMSWVFLAGDRVFNLRKPAQAPVAGDDYELEQDRHYALDDRSPPGRAGGRDRAEASQATRAAARRRLQSCS